MRRSSTTNQTGSEIGTPSRAQRREDARVRVGRARPTPRRRSVGRCAPPRTPRRSTRRLLHARCVHPRRRGRDEVRAVLRAPGAAPVGRRRRAPGLRARRSSRSSSPTGSASTAPGSSSTTSSRSTRTRARPSCSSPRRRSARSGSGSGTASCTRVPAINHPARVAERIATLDVLSGGRVEFGTGEGSAAAELDAFGVDPADKRAMWEEGVRVALRCLTETPFTGHVGEHVRMPPRNVVPKPVQRPHPPVWVACSRRETIHLAAQHGIGALVVRVLRSRGGAALGRRLLHDARDRGRADRRRGEREPRVRHVVLLPSRRGRGRAARRRRRELHRLLARSLLRVRPPPARAPAISGPSTASGAPSRASTPKPSRSRPGTPTASAPRSSQDGTTRAARRDGHARAGARVPAPLRGLRRRPGDPVVRGRPQPPRAHHGDARAVRARGHARVRRARRAPRARQGGAARAGDRGGDGPQAGRRPPAARSRLRDPRLPAPRRRPRGEREVPPLARRLRRARSPPARTSASGSPDSGSEACDDPLWLVGVVDDALRPVSRSATCSISPATPRSARSADAGLTMADVGVLAAGTVFHANESVGQQLLKQIGQTGIPVYNVANACATGATALRTRVHGDLGRRHRRRARGRCRADGQGRTARRRRRRARAARAASAPEGRVGAVASTDGLLGTETMPGVFAMAGLEYADEHDGVALEQFARVAEKNHAHSTLNPLAQYRKRFTLDEILAAPMIAYPNTTPDVQPDRRRCRGRRHRLRRTSSQPARRCRSRAVKISASVITTDPWSERGQALPDFNTLTRNAARRGLRDRRRRSRAISTSSSSTTASRPRSWCTTTTSVCAHRARPASFIDEGAPWRDGPIPVNVSGGLLSKGHPVGATGIAGDLRDRDPPPRRSRRPPDRRCHRRARARTRPRQHLRRAHPRTARHSPKLVPQQAVKMAPPRCSTRSRHDQQTRPEGPRGVKELSHLPWPACPEQDSNLYAPEGTGGFKPPASAVPPPGPRSARVGGPVERVRSTTSTRSGVGLADREVERAPQARGRVTAHPVGDEHPVDHVVDHLGVGATAQRAPRPPRHRGSRRSVRRAPPHPRRAAERGHHEAGRPCRPRPTGERRWRTETRVLRPPVDYPTWTYLPVGPASRDGGSAAEPEDSLLPASPLVPAPGCSRSTAPSDGRDAGRATGPRTIARSSGWRSPRSARSSPSRSTCSPTPRSSATSGRARSAGSPSPGSCSPRRSASSTSSPTPRPRPSPASSAPATDGPRPSTASTACGWPPGSASRSTVAGLLLAPVDRRRDGRIAARSARTRSRTCASACSARRSCSSRWPGAGYLRGCRTRAPRS